MAEIAQRWANQCSFGNEDCRDVARFAVGQNYARMLSNKDQRRTLSDVLMMWYNEVVYNNRFQVNNLRTLNKVGNYTQMVWAGTKMVGCGKIIYELELYKRYYMVCNYGPAGNILGQPVYLGDY